MSHAYGAHSLARTPTTHTLHLTCIRRTLTSSRAQSANSLSRSQSSRALWLARIRRALTGSHAYAHALSISLAYDVHLLACSQTLLRLSISIACGDQALYLSREARTLCLDCTLQTASTPFAYSARLVSKLHYSRTLKTGLM